MLATLPASAVRTRRSATGVAWSLVVHVTIIGSATLIATDDGGTAPAPATRDTTIVFLPPPDPGRDKGSSGGDESVAAPAPRPVSPIPLPAAPITVPTELPPIDTLSPVMDRSADQLAEAARRSLGSGAEGVIGGAGSRGAGVVIATAERAALALPGNPRPRYPDALRAAAVEGAVVAEFVVDARGVIDVETVRIIASDHALFEAAVRDILPRLRFLPAEAAGRTVRQMVRQPFQFRLERD